MVDISIIMPVYNNEKYLDESIQSIINLSYTKFEFIIIDDYSTDKSIQIIKKYENMDKRIRFYMNEKNIGSAKTIKRGINFSNSKYVFLAAADDISFKDRIQKHLDIYNKNLNIGVIVSNATIIDENGKYTGEKYIVNDSVTNENIYFNQFKRNYCLGATMSFVNDKEILLQANMLNYTDDFEIAIEYLVNNYDIYLLKEDTIKYRMHGENQSNRNSELNRRVVNVYNKYTDEEIINFLYTKNIVKEEVFITLGIIKMFVEDYNNAEKYFLISQNIFRNNNIENSVELNFYLGVLNFIMKKLEESLEYFKKCFENDNFNAEFVNNYSVVKYYMDNDIISLKLLLKKSLEIKGDYLDAKYNLECVDKGLDNFKITRRMLDVSNITRSVY